MGLLPEASPVVVLCYIQGCRDKESVGGPWWTAVLILKTEGHRLASRGSDVYGTSVSTYCVQTGIFTSLPPWQSLTSTLTPIPELVWVSCPGLSSIGGFLMHWPAWIPRREGHCRNFISVVVIRYRDKNHFRGETGLFQLQTTTVGSQGRNL